MIAFWAACCCAAWNLNLIACAYSFTNRFDCQFVAH
jgi:hypothetical protein